MDRGATLTKAEAARLLKVSLDTLDKWIERGVIASSGRGVDRASLDEVAELGEKALRDSDSPSEARVAARQRVLERTRAITSTDANAILAGRESDWDPED